MLRSIAFSLALLAFAGTLGCLYVPPLTHASGRGEVVALKAGEETRQTLKEKLGAPDVVDLPSVQVWEWQQNKGTLFVGWAYGGRSASLLGERFRVLARLEGDRAVALETEMEPGKEPAPHVPPLPDPMERFQLGPLNPGSAPSPYRAWVAPGGRLFAIGHGGDLWVRDAGPSQARKVTDLGETSGKVLLNETQGSFSPEGRFLAIARGDWITVWDAVEGKVAVRLPVFEPNPARKLKNVRGLTVFSPDGKWLAVVGATSSFWGGKDPACVRILGVATWKPVWALEEAQPRKFQGPHAVQFSLDGTRLLADGSLYDAATGRRIAQSPFSHAVFYAEGGRFAVLGDALQLHDTESGRLLGQVFLRTGSNDERKANLMWMIADQPLPQPHGWKAFTARVLPDGVLVAAGKGVLIHCDLLAAERALKALTPPAGEVPSLDGGSFLQVRLLPLRRGGERSSWLISPNGDYLLERARFMELNMRQIGSDLPPVDRSQWLLESRTIRTLWGVSLTQAEHGEALFLEDGRFLRTIGNEIRIWALPKPEPPLGVFPTATTPTSAPGGASVPLGAAAKNP